MKAAYQATRPAECYDWLPVKDFIGHALTAYHAARNGCRPPRGQRFLDGGEPWSSPGDFAENLAQLLVLRLGAAADVAGIPGHEYAAEQLEAWGIAFPEAGVQGRSPCGERAMDGPLGRPASPAVAGAGSALESSNEATERREVGH